MHFDIMNTINKLTGYSPFQLKMGQSPRMILTLLPHEELIILEEETACNVVMRFIIDTLTTQNNLLQAKMQQAMQANKTQADDCQFKVGNHVLICTKNKKRLYKKKEQKRVEKLMLRYNGPFMVTSVHSKSLNVTVFQPNNLEAYRQYHILKLLSYNKNNALLFPAYTFEKPRPVFALDMVHTLKNIL